MTGEELRKRIKQSGLTFSQVARKLDTSPQNLNAKLNSRTIKTDLWEKVYNIIDNCCPPVTEEQEKLITGHHAIANGAQSVAAINSKVDGVTALAKENETLRAQNAFLQKQVDRLMSLLEKK